MRCGSVCSGIEAATVAWHPLGWEPSFFSEIESFPRAVLQHHYPDVPLHGDFTTIGADEYGSIDLLVGGTPCQSFSIAGLRKGLDDERGNLALEYLRLAQRTRPAWLVWENVPGVLSSNGGRDFGAFLGGLGELGYGFAYRVLDAQFFGVPQRRRRVFVVGHLGDWRPAAAVLFERHSLQGHPAPRREAREAPADRVVSCLAESSGNARPGDNIQSVDCLHPQAFRGGKCSGPINVAATLTAKGVRQDFEVETFVTQTQYGEEVAGTITARHDTSPRADRGQNAVAFGWQNSPSQGDSVCDEFSPTLDKSKIPAVAQPIMAVRRLTPREFERLQGFPDDFTKIPYRNKPADQCPDDPRYKALGNSMAVPVMRWIGERIKMVQEILDCDYLPGTDFSKTRTEQVYGNAPK